MASSSCKPDAARLINNTPRVVALSRNEAWRSGGSAATRGVLFISRLSVLCQNNIVFNIEKFQMLSDNGPILTLASSARWPSLFERILAVEEGEGAHSEPLAFVWVYTTGNFAKFYDLEEFPYDFPETLHASLYWLVMKKCRRQLFPNWTVCGDRGEKHLFWTPKKRDF